ncbi:hypothetical protein P7C73_g4880, partial [Tremellales sp. Uapishka_1]
MESPPPDFSNDPHIVPYASTSDDDTSLSTSPPSSTPHRSKTAPALGPQIQLALSATQSPLTSPASIPADESTSSSSSTNHSPTRHTSLRRTSSSLSAGKEKKRLRFTPLTAADEVFPGNNYRYAEEGKGGGGKGVPRDQAGYLKSDPGTPNLLETADQIRRTLSLANLDSLLLISQNPSGEREKLMAEVKDLVWRGSDERKLFPQDGERASVLAIKRGLRSFILAFSVRAGVSVLLLLLRTLRRNKLKFRLVLHAIFGAEPFRFGAMIGGPPFLL